ncbi:MAG TPA: TlpA family protein disulfide reductase [Thiotrichaceae bacterium]|jgi:peroxiredoxin|nr:TlpA family protein disulfide reductase [Thiotrichaceae bacterium]HIM07345.1 TlpA family protein disulfide reductase [Gammaproteobacteria bacterium]
MKKLFFPVTAVAILTVVSLFLYLNHNKLDVVPEISLNIIDGRKIELHSLKGKPLLVTFWATTCATCIKEMPHLIELYDELGQEELEIIAIAMSYDPPNRVIELSKRKNIPYPVALDINGSAAKAFGDVQVTPSSFLIDANGNIVQQRSGVIDIKALRTKVKALLKTTSTTVS